MTHLKEGDKAPYFEAEDTDGNRVKSSDFKGKNLVLYFYPKDDTPGCTREACDFRDSIGIVRKMDAEIVGVSGDSKESHLKFTKKYSLNFPLLIDSGNKIAKDYGAYGEKSFMGRAYMGIIRSTFVIDGKGITRKVFYKVKVDGHSSEVTEALNNKMQ